MQRSFSFALAAALVTGLAAPVVCAPVSGAVPPAAASPPVTAAVAPGQAGSIILNVSPPPVPTRLIFIHHSTGENLLADDNGRLGIALANNRYFVSDTNYGWGPDLIGDTTDIGHWWLWFRGPSSTTYLTALYAEGLQNASYSRLATTPAGPNEIVLFKSCFPNSALGGLPTDPVPPIATNPLVGHDSYSPDHTVANAKGIYISLLDYFRTAPDQLFVVLTAPPLVDPTSAANARAFNQWLTTQWLADYPYRNVAVFDFYNVLTTNGGSPAVNDLGRLTGNHHRLFSGFLQHQTDGDNDANPNVSEYPSGDDHPSRAGNLKATAEFVPVLNAFYHCWRGTGGCPGAAPSALFARATSSSGVILSWQDNSADETGFAIERKAGGCAAAAPWVRVGTAPGNAVFLGSAGLAPATAYGYRINAVNARGRSAYSNCATAVTGPAGTPNSSAGLTAVATGAAAVALSWVDQSTNETRFWVYRQAGAGAWLLRAAVGPGVQAFTDTAAPGNTGTVTYRYVVTPCNALGCAPVTPVATVPYPATVLTAAAAGVGRIALGWTDRSDNETGFVVYRQAGTCASPGEGVRITTTAAGVASFIDTGLTSGQRYAYRVRSVARSPDRPYATGYSLASNCVAAAAP